MKSRIPTALLGALALTFAGGAFAQNHKAEVPPPPDINDPGVQPAPAASIPRLPSMRDPAGDTPPTVTVRKEGTDTVQEYRHNGQIYMIRIIPKHGVTQTFIDTNGDGKLEPDPRQSKVAPVYFTLYQWD